MANYSHNQLIAPILRQHHSEFPVQRWPAEFTRHSSAPKCCQSVTLFSIGIFVGKRNHNSAKITTSRTVINPLEGRGVKWLHFTIQV